MNQPTTHPLDPKQQHDPALEFSPASRSRAFAVGILAAPILWGIQLLIGYALTGPACTTGSKVPIYALSILSGVLTIAAGVIAWRQWAGADRRAFTDLDTPDVPRTFLGSLGATSTLLFFWLILGTGLAIVVLSPCPLLNMPLP